MLAVPACTDKPPANRAAQTGEHAETSVKPTRRKTGERSDTQTCAGLGRKQLGGPLAIEFQKGVPVTDLDRITQSPDMMSGRPCIRGMRVTVSMIVGQIGTGVGIDELLTDYPYLEREDIMQALRYAAWRSGEREVLLASA